MSELFITSKELDIDMRAIEKKIRLFKRQFLQRLSKGSRVKKFLLDSMPAYVDEMTLVFDDHKMSVPIQDMIGRHVFANGHYTRDMVEKLLVELKREDLLGAEPKTLLEIGANIGTHTVYFACTGAFSKQIAVEPEPGNLAFLERNISINGLQDRVTVVPCAAGAEPGKMMLRKIDRNSGNASFLHADEKSSGSVEVNIERVDTILNQCKVSADDVGLIWMDIEGFEPTAIQSMESLITRGTPLYLEFSPEFYGPEQTRSFASSLASHYSRATVWRKGGIERIKTEELGKIQRQCDVLLLK